MTRRSGPSFTPAGRRLPGVTGGLVALVVPVLLSIPAVRAVLGDETDPFSDPTAPLLSGLLFLVAAPTAWLVSLLGLSPRVTLILSAVTSLPLWFAVGALIAAGARRWRDWWARYLTVVVAWSVGFVLVLAAVAGVTG